MQSFQEHHRQQWHLMLKNETHAFGMTGAIKVFDNKICNFPLSIRHKLMSRQRVKLVSERMSLNQIKLKLNEVFG